MLEPAAAPVIMQVPIYPVTNPDLATTIPTTCSAMASC